MTSSPINLDSCTTKLTHSTNCTPRPKFNLDKEWVHIQAESLSRISSMTWICCSIVQLRMCMALKNIKTKTTSNLCQAMALLVLDQLSWVTIEESLSIKSCKTINRKPLWSDHNSRRGKIKTTARSIRKAWCSQLTPASSSTIQLKATLVLIIFQLRRPTSYTTRNTTNLLWLPKVSSVETQSLITSNRHKEGPQLSSSLLIKMALISVTAKLIAHLTTLWPSNKPRIAKTSRHRLQLRVARSDQSPAKTSLKSSGRTNIRDRDVMRVIHNHGSEVEGIWLLATARTSARHQIRSKEASPTMPALCFTSRRNWSKDSLRINRSLTALIIA